MDNESIRPNQLRQDALSGRLTFDQARNRILGRQDDGLARLLILANGIDFSMKISAENIDVLTAGLDELIFNSDNNLFKIVDSGEATISLPMISHGSSGSGSALEPHSVGVEPLVLAWAFSDIGGGVQMSQFPSPIVNAKSVNTTAVTIGYVRDEQMTVSDTDIIFSIDVANSTGFSEPATDITIKYYLLTETIT